MEDQKVQEVEAEDQVEVAQVEEIEDLVAEGSVDLVEVISEAKDQVEAVETEIEDEEVLTAVPEIEMVVLIDDQVQTDQDIEVVNSILF